MSLINELRAKSENTDNIKREVIEEIKAYFDEYLDGDGLENYLRKTIGTTDIKARKTFKKVEFWEYHSGCSTTHFSCAGRQWRNPENEYGWESHKYKGVELCTINREIGNYLSAKLERKMHELGFTLISKEDQNSRFGYYHINYYFGW